MRGSCGKGGGGADSRGGISSSVANEGEENDHNAVDRGKLLSGVVGKVFR